MVSGDVRGHPPLLEEGREMPAVTELQVAIIERFHEKGSLKDYMHRVRGGLGGRRLCEVGVLFALVLCMQLV